MDTNTTYEEALLLDSVDNEIAETGNTNKRCPRCGNDIILERQGNSYSIRCKTEGCIGIEYRGI